MEINDHVVFKGFYNSDFNDRAKTSGREISINLAFLERISHDELERVVYHELQHVLNNRERDESAPGDFCEGWLFMFHQAVEDLHQRMLQFFTQHKNQGYQFSKSVSNIPKDINFVDPPSLNYFHPDELLALLRGYKKYLDQKTRNPNIESEPYGFIDAFKPEDLVLLDLKERLKLANEVCTNRPEIISRSNSSLIKIIPRNKR